jgi:hypothetical protein
MDLSSENPSSSDRLATLPYKRGVTGSKTAPSPTWENGAHAINVPLADAGDLAQ